MAAASEAGEVARIGGGSMILDKGICTVFRKEDTSSAGDMPSWGYTRIGGSWYGELSFSSRPVWQTEGRKELKVENKIRILQDRQIRENDIVVLEDLTAWANKSSGAVVYDIVKVWHGIDDDGPTPVTDLTLEVVSP